MLSQSLVIGAALLWLAILFGVALWGERRSRGDGWRWRTVYALSLAVYCTSWTFYGTVTQAARSGWWMPPTFVGTIVLYVLGFVVVERLVRLAREHDSTSLADLVATRLRRSSWVAAAVTLVAVLGMVPYLALQLKAVAMSHGLLTRAAESAPPAWQDSALYVALAMAVFVMLFGTRRASAAEHNRGLVLAMAFESLFKLGVMLALGAFVVFGLDPPPPGAALETPRDTAGFAPLVLLGALAMLTLPHQVHVGAIECRDVRHLRTARWLFPLYMVLIALPILPIAQAGDLRLAGLGVPSDLYVLALPLSEGREGLALLGFLGGLSAATGMVVVATLSLSVMIGNHWLAPLQVRSGRWGGRSDHDLRATVLWQRRLAILAIVLMAWGYSRATAGSAALADIGAVSFSALAVLTPAVLFALWRPQTPPSAVLWGLLAGALVWCWLLLVPLLMDAQAPAWMLQGPFGIAWLAPDAFLGLDSWSRLGRAVVFSLLAAWLVTRLLAAQAGAPRAVAERGIDAAVLRNVAARFLPPTRLREALRDVPDAGWADARARARIERELAAVLGSASAKLLLEAAQREQGPDLEAVATIVGEASQQARFSQAVLEAALQNMSQGISVVDAELKLVAWNARYAALFDYPQDLLQVGMPVERLVRHNARRGLAGEQDVEAAVGKRLAHMRAGTAYVAERRFPDGTVVEIRGNPMPGGGFVASFTDVTDFRRAEAELKRVAETLELRVEQRTAELARASAAAERANLAKTRFLAAISHDMAQPLHAARLFAHALGQQLDGAPQAESVRHIEGALGSAESLLSGLLDISRLDAGGMTPQPQVFALDALLAGLAAEAAVMAGEKGLALRRVPTRVWVRSDPQLLRRVMQNFLANAVRYTREGRILLGCRRVGDAVRIEVVDTGPGIAEADRDAIFEEFRRLDRGGQGLGLGLAIAERIARLLGHPIGLRSQLGRGTAFGLEVPLAVPVPATPAKAPAPVPPAPRLRVLAVDNDAAVLAGMRTLLEAWGCDVTTATTAEAAAEAFARHAPQLLLMDFHLDAGVTGLDVRTRLGAEAARRPCVIITADQHPGTRAAIEAAGCHLLYKPLKPLALKSLMARLAVARNG